MMKLDTKSQKKWACRPFIAGSVTPVNRVR